MGLNIWDENGDPYNHSQLAFNFEKLDSHTHIGILNDDERIESAGNGNPIEEKAIQTEAITKRTIANHTITGDRLVDHTVTHEQIGLEEVLSENIGNEQVEQDKIKKRAVGWEQLEREIVPLGKVEWFYKAPESNHYHICDGTAWSSIENKMGPNETKLTEGSIPNLLDKYIIGVPVLEVGTELGSNEIDLEHEHTVDAHVHTVNAHDHEIEPHNHENEPHTHTVNPHEHAVNAHEHGAEGLGTNEAGEHEHYFGSESHSISSRTNAFIDGLTILDTNDNEHSNTLQSLYIGGEESEGEKNMTDAGLHNHVVTGNTAAAAPNTNAVGLTTNNNTGALVTKNNTKALSTGSVSLTTNSASPGTSEALVGLTNIRPASYGLTPYMIVL